MSSLHWLNEEQSREIDPILDCLVFLASRADRPSSPILIKSGLALSSDGTLPFHQIEPALEQIGMRADPITRRLKSWPSQKLPAILSLTDDRVAVMLDLREQDALLYLPGVPEPMWVALKDLETVYAGRAIIVEADPTQERLNERPWDSAKRRHWFWSELWKIRSEFWPVILAALIVNLLAFAMPLFTMNVYDRVIPNKAVATLWVLAAGVILALGLEFLLRVARARLIDELGRKLDAKLSQKLFEKVMNLPLSAREGSTGALARRVSDYENVRDFFASTTVVLAVDVTFLFLFLALITVLAGWLVLVPLTGIVVMLIAGLTLQKSMSQAALDAQADASLQHSVLVESIAGTETLKAARAEGQMLGRWQRYSAMSATTQERMRRLTGVAVNLASVAQQMISVGLLVGGFYRFQQGEMTMGAIIAIIMLSSRSLQPIGQLAFLFTRGKQAFATLASIEQMMQVEDERKASLRSILPEIRAGHIEFRDVTFRYPQASRDSLVGVNLTIKPGERIGIIGKVASGKSTLGRLMCGLHVPTSGEILVDGLDSRQYHPHQLRQELRFVSQDADVFSGTVRDNLLLGAADAEDSQLIDAVIRSGADIFLSRDAAGFDLPVGERGSRLSGGQRALLVLARSLVSQARLLYLDEPTGSMDTQTEQYFIDRLDKALGPQQTLVVATHRHNMLSIVNRLIVIDGGKILADGPRDDVLSHLTAATAKKKGGRA